MFSKLSILLDSFLDLYVPGYDCLVYYKGNQVFRQFGGYSSLEDKTPMNGNEQYFLYSCSKPITSVAGLICLEKGLFQLSDKVSLYLPEFTSMTVQTPNGCIVAQNPILVKDLFCMTAGFGYDVHCKQLEQCISDLHGTVSTRDAIRYLAKEPLLFEPGLRWEYSFCHDVLAALIEVVSGQVFSDFAKDNIFRKIGMYSTTFRMPDNTSKIAGQYRLSLENNTLENIGKKIADFSNFGDCYESGGGGCISTIQDSMKFLEALRTGEQLLTRDTITKMTTNQLNAEQMKTYWMSGYGYGLGVKCSIGKENCTDFGWGGMAGSLMSVDIENELSIMYCQHAIGSKNDIGRYMIPALVREALGLDTNPVKSTLEKENIYI